jgi:hypothetical protein
VAEAKDNGEIEIWGDGCFPKGELVLTVKGLMDISALTSGDIVFGKTGMQKIKTIFKKEYVGDLYTIFTKGCIPIECTKNHPILIKRLNTICKKHSNHYCKPNCFCLNHKCSHEINTELIWITPNEINLKTDYVCVPKLKQNSIIPEISLYDYIGGHKDGRPQEQPKFSKFKINEDWAWLLGLYLAEGSSNPRTKIFEFSLGIIEEGLALKLKEKLNNVGLHCLITKRPEKSSIKVSVRSRPICKWLKDIFGARANVKIIPYFVYNLPNKLIELFIDGYHNGDGTKKWLYSTKRTKITSSSKNILVGLQLLFAKLNKFGTIFWKNEWYKRKNSSCGTISYSDSKGNVQWFSDDNYVYVKIKKLKIRNFIGDVYNIETEDNTYAMPYIVHNSQTRSFLYINECLEGVRRLMDSDFMGPVNIGSDEMVTINQLAEIVMGIAGKKINIKHIPGPLGVRGRNSDNKLIQEKLNWSPSSKLEDGLRETYKWINERVKERIA